MRLFSSSVVDVSVPRACLLLLLFLTLLFGCASTKTKKYKSTYWPKPPEAPRYVYEGSLRSAVTLAGDSTSYQLRSMLTGESKADSRSFAKPFDVAARGGKIVVTDTVSRNAIMFDVPRRKVFPFGHRGDGKGKDALNKPLGVGMDAKQWVYIADVSAKDVKVFDSLGMLVRVVGSKEVFERPVDVAASDSGDRIYVLDVGGISSEKHRVVVFDAEGNKVNEFGKRGSAEGDFNLPSQLTVGRDGNLYVLDAKNFRVQVFSAEGEFIRAWGKVGRSLGDLSRPRGIAVDNENNVYVTDAVFRNLQIFKPTGELLMFIGDQGLDDKPGQYVLPAGIAVDETKRVYIVDQVHFKVEVLRKLGDAEVNKLTNPSPAPVSSEQVPASVSSEQTVTKNTN